MWYWNRDHRGRAVTFFFDFSLALAFRNLNTFAELMFIVDLLPKTSRKIHTNEIQVWWGIEAASGLE